MIVTVKLGNLEYHTFSLKLGDGPRGSDADFLEEVNELIRQHLWNNVFDLQDKRYYRSDYNAFPAPPIVMMYSRNRYSHDH